MEGGGGDGATTARVETMGAATLWTATPTASVRAEALLARLCAVATTLVAFSATRIRATTLTEAAVTVRLIAAGGTLSEEARRTVKSAWSKTHTH